MKVELTVT